MNRKYSFRQQILLKLALAGIATFSFFQQLNAETIDNETVYVETYDGSFGDAESSLITAIEARGLKVDHISNVGEMLSRTAEAVGADTLTYENAKVFQFCSAVLSRKMMELNPENVAFCPYQLFVYQLSGQEEVFVGYRKLPEGDMQEVETLYGELLAEVLAF